MTNPRYDVVAFGETMIRFSPPGFLRLEQSDTYELHVGGSESNTAAGLARLGRSVCWLSRLTENALGRKITGILASHGVDTSYVVWTDRDRVGVYYYELGSPPRASEVVYDRAGSAFAQFPPEDLVLEPLKNTRVFHTTGISLALSDSVRAALNTARSTAVASGGAVSFDFNYRAKLWSMAQAKQVCESWMTESDLVFIAKRDAVAWFGLAQEPEDLRVLEDLIQMRKGKLTVMTLGARGAMAGARMSTRSGTSVETHFVATTPVEPIGRLGGGDAFSAGFLDAWLEDQNIEKALRWANA
ncbi:MAG: sugar kinase, partial [Planctomycetes bacterium]|nr:sugar kinase [Planctomycetota bacterium]